MPNSDLLPISDFFGFLFARSFNCDAYPIHVFTLAIPSETSRMRCCHLVPPHVLPPENNVTCAGKTSRANVQNELCLFSHSPLKDLQNDVWFFGIGQKMTATPIWSWYRVSKVDYEKDSSFPPILFLLIIRLLYYNHNIAVFDLIYPIINKNRCKKTKTKNSPNK